LLKNSHVQPAGTLPLHRLIIGLNEIIVGEAAANLPEGGGEGAASAVERPFTPKHRHQEVAGKRPLVVAQQVSKQRLGFERSRFGQRRCFQKKLEITEALDAQVGHVLTVA
jgi:hypothetical protein